MSLAASVALGLLILLAVAAYLVFALPRLSGWRALAASVAGTIVLLALAAWLSPMITTAPMLGAAALVAGHAGWWLGWRAHAAVRAARRQQRQPGATRSGRRAKPGSRRPPEADRSIDRAGAPPHGKAPLYSADVPPPTPAMPRTATAPLPVSPPSPSAMATGPLPAAPAPVAASSGLPMADLQRTSLGRYRIDRAIGRGSMGAVFLGLDPLLGRQVAIKTMALGQEFAGAELVEAKQRFFREAETAGRLQHRDIVTIYDVGEEQDLAYIAMEFLKGHDLQRHTVGAQLLPASVVLRIGARVADALGYAHSQGVIHRDVKPANVMLHLPSGAVKVTDFGIARVTDASRTRTGMVLGTPSFMSPEHLAGQRVDGRTDLYSLGVMLFQLLTGQLPFQADSMARLMFRIANDDAPDVRSLRPDLPEALARVLARALSKSPAARQSDGAQMAAELRALDPCSADELLVAETGTATGVGAASPAGEGTGAYDATVRLPPGDSGHNSAP